MPRLRPAAASIPADYIRKQTVKNAERYITPELKEHEEQVLRAEDRACELEYELFTTLARPGLGRSAPADPGGGRAGPARCSGRRWPSWPPVTATAVPEIVAEPVFEVEAGRHPVLDAILPPGDFVPNDVHLGGDAGLDPLDHRPQHGGQEHVYPPGRADRDHGARGELRSGQASAGSGSSIACSPASGATDDLSRSQSTFMVEMSETANILNNATPRSLVILDEVGRGTSTFDGISLAWAITEHIHDAIGCRTLFATHYHELVELEKTKPRLRNANVAVRESDGEIVFLYRISPGGADQSYGIHVARLAGVSGAGSRSCREILKFLEKQHGPDPGLPEGPIRKKVKTGRALAEQPVRGAAGPAAGRAEEGRIGRSEPRRRPRAPAPPPRARRFVGQAFA